jgi:hypothetical protein
MDKKFWIGIVMVPLIAALIGWGPPDICKLTNCYSEYRMKIYYRNEQSNLVNLIESELSKFGLKIESREYKENYGPELRWYWHADKDATEDIKNKINSVISKTEYKIRISEKDSTNRSKGHDKSKLHLYL